MLFAFVISAFGSALDDSQCGALVGDRACPIGSCCSTFGWCGTSYAHCQHFCAYQCNTTTETDVEYSGIRSDGQCGYNFNGAVCSSGNCCSIYGICGNTDEHCQPTTCAFQCHPKSVAVSGKTDNICTNIALNVQPTLNTKMDSQGVIFPAYRNNNGNIHFSVRFANDCVDSTDTYVKVTVEAQDEDGAVYELAQSTASTTKTPFQATHQGDEENWFPGNTDSFFWYHKYL